MPSKIVITFTETEETVETRISTETSGSELENEAAKIFKQKAYENLMYWVTIVEEDNPCESKGVNHE